MCLCEPTWPGRHVRASALLARAQPARDCHGWLGTGHQHPGPLRSGVDIHRRWGQWVLDGFLKNWHSFLDLCDQPAVRVPLACPRGSRPGKLDTPAVPACSGSTFTCSLCSHGPPGTWGCGAGIAGTWWRRALTAFSRCWERQGHCRPHHVGAETQCFKARLPGRQQA